MAKALSIRRRKELARSDKSRLSPRKQALLYRKSVPEDRLGPALSARRRGSSMKVAAQQGRLTVDELRYVLELGEGGHPAYREFFDEWMLESSRPMLEVHEAALEDALHEERRTPERMKFAMAIMDPEAVREREQVVTGKGQMQTQNFVVNLRERFEPVEVPDMEVLDAEDAEVVNG